MTTQTTKKLRGLARLSLEERRAICSKGGKQAHANGNAYKFTTEKAREAGAIGGRISRRGPSKKVMHPQ